MTSIKKKQVVPRLVADDNGYADHKFAWLDSDGRIMTGKVPTLIQVGGQGLSSVEGKKQGAYLVDGVEYTCSTAVSTPMRLRNGDYPTSDANRILFTHGLARFGLLGMPVMAAVTLPFRDYYLETGEVNVALREATKASFEKGNVEVVGCESQPIIEDVKVKPEAIAAWFDWAIDDEGELTPGYQEMVDMNGQVLVIDIGGSTTDLASLHMTNETFEGEMAIQQGKSGTEKVGVLDAKAKLEELVRTAMSSEGVTGMSGHGEKFPSHWLDRVMQNGKANYSSREWDFKSERETACRGVAERISSYVKTTVGNIDTYMTVLVVGGGAIVFQPWLEKFLPNAVFMDEFSNARGLLKFMRSEQE